MPESVSPDNTADDQPEEMTADQIILNRVLRSQIDALSAVAGTMPAKVAAATAALMAGESSAVSVYNANKQTLAELKQTVADNKSDAENEIKEWISANNTGPTAAEIRAGKAAIIATMKQVLPKGCADDLEQPISLTGRVMGGSGTSPFYYVKKDGTRSYRDLSALAADPYKVGKAVLITRLNEISDDNTGESGDVSSWERVLTIGTKSATVGFTAPIVSDDDDDDRERTDDELASGAFDE